MSFADNQKWLVRRIKVRGDSPRHRIGSTNIFQIGKVPLQILQNSGTAINILFSFCEMSLLTKKNKQKQWPQKFHIKFRNTNPPPPYLGIIPKKKQFLTASLRDAVKNVLADFVR